MDLSPEFVKKVEIKYLRILSSLIKKGAIDSKTAKASAKLFLTFLPFSTIDDIKTKLKFFIDNYPQFSDLYLFILKETEELETNHVLEKMRNFMKNKDVDNAIKLVQK